MVLNKYFNHITSENNKLFLALNGSVVLDSIVDDDKESTDLNEEEVEQSARD